MKTKIIALMLSILLSVPCVLHAEEVVITLLEVVEMTQPSGVGPLDNSEKEGTTPTRPNDFRATINGNTLSINKLESAIPSAQATVVNASTGSIVVNQQFTSSLTEQISTSGVYVLHIQTATGALVGQFVVQ